MKNLLLIIFIFGFLSACESIESAPSKSKRNYSSLGDTKFRRINSRLSYKPKPSESMQIGRSNYAQQESKYAIIEFGPNEREESESQKYEGTYKIGNPYEIFGVSYFPQNYEEYEETGTASWYGDEFHGRPTANGETYDMNIMTAAHPTLPLPSMVRVTNLGNGKVAIVRVNDRGPFAKSRIIDVSEKAAIALGFKDIGTAQVKIELLKNDTDELLEQLQIKN